MKSTEVKDVESELQSLKFPLRSFKVIDFPHLFKKQMCPQKDSLWNVASMFRLVLINRHWNAVSERLRSVHSQLTIAVKYFSISSNFKNNKQKALTLKKVSGRHHLQY